MSDGGGESREPSRKRVGGDDFAHAIAKIAVAQVCEVTGFQGFHQSALDAFSDVAVRYIRQVGQAGGFYANLAGRSESNPFDIIQGLEDLGLPQGFPGASETSRCVAGSGVIREITRYVSEEGENSFAYAIPSFPIVKDQKSVASFAQVRDSPPGEHIPAWLPVFPEPQTYSQERQEDEKKIEPFKEGKDLESSSHQHMSCNGSEAPIVADPRDAAKGKQVVGDNPYLAPPLRFGEKEVSLVVIPPKLLDGTALRELDNHVPVFEVLSPVAKRMKSPLKDTSEEVKEKVFPNTRPTVQFKLKSLKKPSRTSSVVKIEDSEQMNLLEVKNDRDERKKRAEQIMKESMDIV